MRSPALIPVRGLSFLRARTSSFTAQVKIENRELTGHRTSAMFDRYAIVSNTDVLAAQKKVAQFRRQA
jgi:hypothetical protein